MKESAQRKLFQAFNQDSAVHAGGDINIHQREHGGNNISQSSMRLDPDPVFLQIGMVGNDMQPDLIGGMGSMGNTRLIVDHLFGIAMIGGQKDDPVVF